MATEPTTDHATGPVILLEAASLASGVGNAIVMLALGSSLPTSGLADVDRPTSNHYLGGDALILVVADGDLM